MTQPMIHRMFARTAERLPDHPAIEEGELRVSYRQLDAAAQRVAAQLEAAGAERGDFVGILADRSADLIAAILGTLEVGCAFVPFDLDHPTVRLDAVIAEANPSAWLVGPERLVDARANRSAEAISAPILALDDLWREAEAPVRATPVEPDPDAVAYLYFTSGSTGQPKAIAGRLKGIDHFVRWEIETFGVAEGSRVSQLTSPAFDAFLRDVFVPLCTGGTVCVPASRETVLDGALLAEWIDRERLEIVHATPSLLRSVLRQDLEGGSFAALRTVLLAGEPVLPADVERWLSLFGERVRLVNLYGPTETTMTKLFHVVTEADAHGRTVPIGVPMPGARALVVDEAMQPCPAGKLGEILLRTPYRSHGYHGRPDLTSEVFVQNPFSDQPGDLVYRTGDLGRLREDGSLEFVGRRDQQVKVRGVRIELAPIEQSLRAFDGVSDAVVVDRTDVEGNKLLCAYVVAGESVELEALRLSLLEALPQAMVPSAFVFLEELPRTLSGKVDRRALPPPGAGGTRGGRERVPPRTPLEEEIADLFCELLSLPEVGVHDSFFELGGHSLLATLLLSRMRSSMGVEVPLRALFAKATVEALALEVTRLQLEEVDDAELAELLDEIQSGAEASAGPAAAGPEGER